MRRATEPRGIRLTEEHTNGEQKSSNYCSYGIDFDRDTELEFKYWRATIWGPPHSTHENRIYELILEVGPEYNQKPPEIYFVSKINLPGVDQRTGKVDPRVIPLLNDWAEVYEQYMNRKIEKPPGIESALLAIRKVMESYKKLEQPPEGSKYDIYK